MKKIELYKKIQNADPSYLKKLNITNEEWDFIKSKLINDKLGLTINFQEIDEKISKNYFGFEEIKNLNINAKDKNNHLIIEGENYHALKALSVANIKVDIIYIDPPYNTGKEFIYNDDFSTKKSVGKDDPHKHSKWLSFMKKRMLLAKELLSDNGIIFISIDDNEQAYLKVLMDEIFGEENFLTNIYWHSKNKPSGNTLGPSKIDIVGEYILCYQRNIKRDIFNNKNNSEEDLKNKNYLLRDEYFNLRGFYKLTPLWHSNSGNSFKYQKSLDYEIIAPDGTIVEIWQNQNKKNKDCYTWSKESFDAGNKLNFIEFKKDKHNRWNVYRKIYSKSRFNPKSKQEEEIISGNPYKNFITDIWQDYGTNEYRNLNIEKSFSSPKPTKLIKFLLTLVNHKNPIVLDFFAGSGTTAQAVMELNEEDSNKRRFVLVTNNENDIATDICRERIYRIINGIGSKRESIKWKFSEEKLYLNENYVKYLRLKVINKIDGEYEDINDMKNLYKDEFNKEISIRDFYD